MKNNKIVKNVVLLMMLTLLSKCIGFIRELVMGYCYGASMYSDAYFTAYDIPKVLFSLIAVAVSSTFIPLYFKVAKEKGEDYTNTFMNNVINTTFFIGVIVSIISFIFMDDIVKIFAIGFKGKVFSETVLFAKIMLIGYIFSGLSSIHSAFLQNKGDFFVPGIIGIPFNFISIISMLLSVYYKNVYILPVGATIALFSQYLVQIPKSIKLGYKPEPVLKLTDKYMIEMYSLVLPLIISVATTQVNTVVDRTLASTLVVGSMSSLNYSNKLVGFFIGIFITTISIVIFPKLSEFKFKDDNDNFKDLIKKSMNIVFILIIPISFVCIVLSKPIVSVLFMRGAFDLRAVLMTSVALKFYAVGMVGLAIRTVVIKVFYSIGDTKTPMINSIITVILNIVFSLILIRPMDSAGLALGTSLSYLVSMVLLFVQLYKCVGNYGIRDILETLVKVVLASILVGIIVTLLFDMFNLLGDGNIISALALCVSAGIGAILYLIFVKLLRLEEINYLHSEIIKRINIKNKSA